MQHRLGALGLSAFAALLLAAHANAESSGEVVAELKALKVLQGADGEVLAPADAIRPGDVLQYEAVYRNAGDAEIRDLAPVLPIPLGLEYLPDSAHPAAAFASLDGRHYDPVPLRRKVILPDGQEEWQDVPYAQYRYLRWDVGALLPTRSTVVRARMRVIPVVPPVSDGPAAPR